MKKAFKKIFIVLFTVVVILVGTAPISSAESKYLIVVNSKKNTLNYYVNYTLVRSFRCSTGKLSTPTPQCKTTIVNKIKILPLDFRGLKLNTNNNPKINKIIIYSISYCTIFIGDIHKYFRFSFSKNYIQKCFKSHHQILKTF